METEAANVSDLGLFLKALAEDGRAVVSREPLRPETEVALDVLRQLDSIARDELAMDAPGFSPVTALWAARLLYHLCQFTVCRDMGEEQIAAQLNVDCPEPRGPETDWSADLTLRHLPNLFQFARQLSNADPLVSRMQQIAISWPLSSVGMAGLENLKLDSFFDHPALRRLYADRITKAAALSRLTEARVRDLLQSDLGMHPNLAPAIAARLNDP